MAVPTARPFPARRRTTDIQLPRESDINLPAESGVTYDELIRTEAIRGGVPPELALAIAKGESTFEALAVGKPTRSGERAIGTMQVLPSTGKDYGFDVHDPVQNVKAGVKHLRFLLERYDADVDKTIAAYNAGHVPVDAAGGIPNFPETQKYVQDVKGFFADYAAQSQQQGQTQTPAQAQQAGEQPTGTTAQPTPQGPAPMSLTPDQPWQLQMSRVGAPMLGAMLGGAKGASVGAVAGLPGVVLGGLAGAGLGAMGGEAIQIGVETIFRELGWSPEGTQPITTEGGVRRLAEASQAGMMGEGGGQALGAVGRLVAPTKFGRAFLQPSGYLLDELQPWAREAIERFQSPGGPVTVLPGQVTQSRFLNFLHNLGRASLIGGGRMARAGQALEKTAQGQALQTLEDLGPAQGRSRVVRGIQAQLPKSPVAQAEEALQPQVTRAEQELERVRLQGERNIEQAAANRAVTQSAAASREAAGEVELTAAQAQVVQGRADRLAQSEAAALRNETGAEQLGRGFGPAGEVEEVGAAALARRQAAERAFREQERAAWGAWEQQAEGVTVDALPRAAAFIAKETGRQEGAVLPNAGMTAARRVSQLFPEPPAQLPGQTVGLLPEARIPDDFVLTINGKRTTFGKLPTGPVRDAVIANYKQNPAKLFDDVVEGSVVQPDTEPLTAVQFQKTISDLRSLAARLGRLAKSDPGTYSKQAGTAKKLLQVVREEFDDVLKDTNPDAFDALETARAVSREGNARLLNRPLLKVMRQDPEKIVDSFLRKNQSTPIRATTRAIGEEGMTPIRAAAWAKVIKRDVKTGQIDYPATMRYLHEIGDNTLHALFPNRETDGLKRIAQSVFEAERNAALQAQAEAAAVAAAKTGLAAAKKTGAQAVEAASETLAQTTKARAVSEAAAKGGLAATKEAVEEGVEAAKAVPDPLRRVRDEQDTNRVIRMMFNADNVEAFNAIRAEVGEDGMRRLERIGLQHILRPDPKTGLINFDQAAVRLNGADPEAFQAVYPGGHAEDIRTLMSLFHRVQGKGPAGGQGTVTVQIVQGGAIASLLQTKFGRAAATTLVIPGVLAYVMSHPVGARWLTTGLKAVPGSPTATWALAHLTAFLARELQREEAVSSPAYVPPTQRRPSPSKAGPAVAAY